MTLATILRKKYLMRQGETLLTQLPEFHGEAGPDSREITYFNGKAAEAPNPWLFRRRGRTSGYHVVPEERMALDRSLVYWGGYVNRGFY